MVEQARLQGRIEGRQAFRERVGEILVPPLVGELRETVLGREGKADLRRVHPQQPHPEVTDGPDVDRVPVVDLLPNAPRAVSVEAERGVTYRQTRS